MDLLDYTDLWSWTTAPVVPPPPPPVDEVSHSPHDWRTANPRLRRLLLRRILPEEFRASDLRELQEIDELTNDLDNL